MLKDHPELVVSLVNLGVVQRERKDLRESEATLRRAVAIANAKFDTGNRDAVSARQELAITLRGLGKDKEAAAVEKGGP